MRFPGAAGWELAWQPAGGGRIRRLGLSRLRLYGLLAALAFSGSALLAGGLVASAERSRTKAGVAAARSLNHSLRARRDDLENRASELGERSGSHESAPQRGDSPRAPH